MLHVELKTWVTKFDIMIVRVMSVIKYITVASIDKLGKEIDAVIILFQIIYFPSELLWSVNGVVQQELFGCFLEIFSTSDKFEIIWKPIVNYRTFVINIVLPIGCRAIANKNVV